MARFLFSIVPAMGHINPTMPVASALAQQGHRVGYATGSDFRRMCEAEGFDFFPTGPPGLQSHPSSAVQKMLKHDGILSNYYFYRALADQERFMLPMLQRHLRAFKPDVLVTDAITFAGAHIAEAAGIPWATSHPLPGLIPSRSAPPFTSWGLAPARTAFTKALHAVIRRGQKYFFGLFDADFNKNRALLGLPPCSGSAASGTLSPFLIFSPTCEGFEYPREDWPPQLHLIGPAPWGKSTGDTDECSWIDDLPCDRPIVYVTLGTVQVLRSTNFFTTVMSALGSEPCHVVMSVGRSLGPESFSNVPPNVRIEPFVPHARILPRVTAVIHHGGQGIAQDSIYHGLPAVVVPISQDLHEIARRCTCAGVAVSIPFARLSAKKLRRAVRRILQDKAMHEATRKLRDIYRKTDAGAAGAALLERLAETGQPVFRHGAKSLP